MLESHLSLADVLLHLSRSSLHGHLGNPIRFVVWTQVNGRALSILMHAFNELEADICHKFTPFISSVLDLGFDVLDQIYLTNRLWKCRDIEDMDSVRGLSGYQPSRVLLFRKLFPWTFRVSSTGRSVVRRTTNVQASDGNLDIPYYSNQIHLPSPQNCKAKTVLVSPKAPLRHSNGHVRCQDCWNWKLRTYLSFYWPI